MATLVSPKQPAFVVLVTGNDGTAYVYGVFDSRESALEFAEREFLGFACKVQEIIVVDRK